MALMTTIDVMSGSFGDEPRMHPAGEWHVP
jgi:hypothetical protein